MNVAKITHIVAVALFIAISIVNSTIPHAHARIIFTNEFFESEADTATIDSDGNAMTAIALRFGAIANQFLTWDITQSKFRLSAPLAVNGNLEANGNILTLDADNTGVGANVDIVAHQGSDPNGVLRYNATADRWEISNNGGTFAAIATGAGVSNAFIQAGNAFGAIAQLGTTDNFPLAFLVNGVERMRVNSSGQVAIGATTIPANKRLTVSNTANPTFNATGEGMGVSMAGGGGIYMKNSTDNVEGKFESWNGAIQVGVSGTVPAPLLLSYDGNFEGARLHTNGNFGIGGSTTDLPTARLDVQGGAAGVLNIARLRNSIAAATNSGASILFAANRTTGGMTNVAGVAGVITDISNAAYKGMLVFQTANNAAPAERMRIDHDGKVGINETSLTDRTTISESASTTAVSALRANMTQVANAANIASQAVNIFATPSGDAGDTLRGILINVITGTASTEHAIAIGNGWDRDVVFGNTSPTLQAPNGFDLSLNSANGTKASVKDMNNGFGGYIETTGFLSYGSYVGIEFSRDDANLNSDGNQVWGDANQLGVDENTNCIWSVLDDTPGGIGRSAVNAKNSSCVAYHSSATGNAQLIFDVAQFPVVIMKARPSHATANDDSFIGLGDVVTANSTGPVNGIYFTNNNGANWVGVTESAGNATNVPCGVSISTTNFALLKIEVRAGNDVRFYVNNGTNDLGNWTYCGSSSTNIPSAYLTTMIMNGSTLANRYLDVDFFRVWQR